MRKYKDPDVTGKSTNRKNWQAVFDEKLCDPCYDAHGLIFITKDHYETYYEIT